ncbi:unnamed protein product [Amoebophrya sp. A120]|nr:unnamed protein product [Amoebophrya sp. A120]|eukprot:GSA120T00018786001.1
MNSLRGVNKLPSCSAVPLQSPRPTGMPDEHAREQRTNQPTNQPTNGRTREVEDQILYGSRLHSRVATTSTLPARNLHHQSSTGRSRSAVVPRFVKTSVKMCLGSGGGANLCLMGKAQSTNAQAQVDGGGDVVAEKAQNGGTSGEFTDEAESFLGEQSAFGRALSAARSRWRGGDSSASKASGRLQVSSEQKRMMDALQYARSEEEIAELVRKLGLTNPSPLVQEKIEFLQQTAMTRVAQNRQDEAEFQARAPAREEEERAFRESLGEEVRAVQQEQRRLANRQMGIVRGPNSRQDDNMSNLSTDTGGGTVSERSVESTQTRIVGL